MTMTEQWDDMTKRHRAERLAMVQDQLDKRITQTQAAANLGIQLGTINNYIHRNGIWWPVKAQGKRHD